MTENSTVPSQRNWEDYRRSEFSLKNISSNRNLAPPPALMLAACWSTPRISGEGSHQGGLNTPTWKETLGKAAIPKIQSRVDSGLKVPRLEACCDQGCFVFQGKQSKAYRILMRSMIFKRLKEKKEGAGLWWRTP